MRYTFDIEVATEWIEQYWALIDVEIRKNLKQMADVKRKVGTISANEGKFIHKISDP